jgi:hypothetical protein
MGTTTILIHPLVRYMGFELLPYIGTHRPLPNDLSLYRLV